MKKYLGWLPAFIWAFLIWRLTTTPDFKVTEDTVLSFIISNGGHFFFFGIQAVFILLALPARIWNLSSNIVAVACASLYGVLIEMVQRRVPGRSADPLDWILDTLGAIAFLAIAKKILNQKFSNSPI